MSSQSPYSHHDAQTYRRNKPNSRKRSSTTLSNFSRGRQKLDAREQTVRENTTNDESNMFANNGPVSYQIINNHSSASGKAGKRLKNSRESQNRGQQLTDHESGIWSHWSHGSSFDISNIPHKFSTDTRQNIRNIDNILNAIQECHRTIVMHLKRLKDFPSASSELSSLDFMLMTLERQESLAFLTAREFSFFGTATDKVKRGLRRDSDPSWISDLLSLLENARRHLEDASKQSSHMVAALKPGGKTISRITASKFRICNERISDGYQYLRDFQTLFSNKVEEALPIDHQRIKSLDDKEVEELNLLLSCRYVSAVLCRQLSSLCNKHDQHHVYVNLGDIEHIQEDNKNWIRFNFAFERRNTNHGGLVWIQAEAVIDPNSPGSQLSLSSKPTTSTSASTRARNSFNTASNRNSVIDQPYFCLESLEDGMNFSFSIGTDTSVQQRPFPKGRSLSITQTPLSISIQRRYFSQAVRIRLARLISEAVLKLDTKLWCTDNLKSSNIMLLESEELQTHLSVCLRQQSNNYDLSRPSQTRITPIRRVLRDLGIILLELAYMEKVSHDEVREKCCEDKLERAMGKDYAEVVLFCLDYHDVSKTGTEMSGTSIEDASVQQYFYQRVIRLLKKDEESIAIF